MLTVKNISSEISILCSAPNLWTHFGDISALDRMLSGLRHRTQLQLTKAPKGIQLTQVGKSTAESGHSEGVAKNLCLTISSLCFPSGWLQSQAALPTRGNVATSGSRPAGVTPREGMCVVSTWLQNLRINPVLVWLRVHTHL